MEEVAPATEFSKIKITTPTEEDDAQQNKKRPSSLISQACDFCKKRHMKCDGCHPCFQCRKREQSCTYSPPKKRGPKPKKRRKKTKKVTTARRKRTTKKATPKSSSKVESILTDIDKTKKEATQWKAKFEKEKEKSVPPPPQPSPDINNGVDNLHANPLQFSLNLGADEGETEKTGGTVQNFAKNDGFLMVFGHVIRPSFPMIKPTFTTHFDLSKLEPETIGKIAQSANFDVLVGAFEYSIACAHGAKLCRDKERKEHFISKAEHLMQYLVMKRQAYHEAKYAQRIFSCLLMMGYFHLCDGAVDKAVMCNMLNYGILMRCGKDGPLSASLITRLYCMMMVGEIDPKTISHWFSLAEENLRASPESHHSSYLCLGFMYLIKAFMGEMSIKVDGLNQDAILWRILSYFDLAWAKLEQDPICKSNMDFYKNTQIVFLCSKALGLHLLNQRHRALEVAEMAYEKVRQHTPTATNCTLGLPISVGFVSKVFYDEGERAKGDELFGFFDSFMAVYPVLQRSRKVLSEAASKHGFDIMPMAPSSLDYVPPFEDCFMLENSNLAQDIDIGFQFPRDSFATSQPYDWLGDLAGANPMEMM